ncbi:unnamed protein product [Cylindrotheca closterium]|uniref:S1 motif domain-containing protein n=1 Tax=Cylindrotheca closterium TaxID=2856 RepID=A0AAD2FLE3_9STRA|nr:unnamed protein product [Cylindrotheca closterium]
MLRDEFGRALKNGHGRGGDNNGDKDKSVKYGDRRRHFENEDRHNRNAGPNNGSSSGNGGHYGPGEEMHVEDGKRGLLPGNIVHGEVVRVEAYGAFVEFMDKQNEQSHRGLVHISQLAPRRVEKVEDVVQLKDKVYAVILSVEEDRRQKRIRLSLVDVNQDRGTYVGREIASQQSSGRRGRPIGQRQRTERARDRRRMYMSYHIDWRAGSEAHTQHCPQYMRILWSTSPEPPSKALIKKNKRQDEESIASSSSTGSSDSDSTTSTEQWRRRRRGDRKRPRDRPRSRDRRSSRRGRGSRRRDYSSDDSSDSGSVSESPTGSRSVSSRSSSSSKSRRSPPPKAEASQDVSIPEEWKESDLKNAQDLKGAVQGKQVMSDEEEGPMPLPQSNAAGGTDPKGNAAYGGALLPGEGQAIAQYVQQNLRIPRRGEIGYSGDDIEHFENSGYVMSGSRHKRMNAVRIRKENQVYSAEEQRALALITMEEKQQQEAQLMEDFRVMLKDKQRVRNERKKG